MSTNTPDKSRRSSSSHFQSKKVRHTPIPIASSSNAGQPERVGDDNQLAVGDRPYHPSRPRTNSLSSQSLGRTPGRSFYHRSFHGVLDPVQYSSSGQREQTAELASFVLSDGTSLPESIARGSPPTKTDENYPEVIEELSEPVTPNESESLQVGGPSTSILTDMLQGSTDQPGDDRLRKASTNSTQKVKPQQYSGNLEPTEWTSLLRDRKISVPRDQNEDIESLHKETHRQSRPWHTTVSKLQHCWHTVSHPKQWDSKAVWQEVVVHPVSILPAVFLGLLLNILDALSYGMILFPLGDQIFADLGSDGIAIFYVSTIVAQVVYSSGGSVFRGGIGSEMIEVVPFFHQMAFTIRDRVGVDDPKSVLATTILSFAVSSILTGLVFFLMGTCKLGSLIGFFPRHILIGCIGGVGWFLVATGIEVSARLPGNLEYNLPTLKQLFRGDTIMLWLIPLVLAVTLLVVQRFVKSNFLVGGYFISVAAIFYFFKFALGIEMDTLHSGGWVFDKPAAGNPWWHFYTLYDFGAVHWGALADTIPAMFALTFFGILHVPINVPALGISTGEDNLNVDRELIAHGISNCLSGLFGSIQNYLAYTNSILFIDSGGNDRLAGLMLAAATFGVLLAGPVIVGYIPIMVVGALIFMLGIELLEEALFDTLGKVHRLEYITILIIVVTMGVYDFVAGIIVGIILAALNFVVQTSRRTAIRATYSGQVARSTVRRPLVQLNFLKETGQQVRVIKLAGFLFFGTIVGVENSIRALLEEEAFRQRPLRYLVLDMTHINGIDFSAAEAFTRINRLLHKRDVELVVSGLELDGEIGRALRNVGLFNENAEVGVFETLNDALESCENQLLTALYRQQESRRSRRATTYLDIPRRGSAELSSSYQAEFLVSSPRRSQLHESATAALADDVSSRQKWSAYKQPLALLLQMFDDVSDKKEDFWYRATKYFERVFFPKGHSLFGIGDRAGAFYLLEEGILRAEYDMPQGKLSELIVAGRPCGELPFFSETARSANMTAEKDCIIWQLTGSQWNELQKHEPELAQELLRISLKLTKERMDVITSYVLTTAS